MALRLLEELKARHGADTTLQSAIDAISQPTEQEPARGKGRPRLPEDERYLLQMALIVIQEGRCAAPPDTSPNTVWFLRRRRRGKKEGVALFAVAKRVLQEAGTPDHILDNRARVLVTKYTDDEESLLELAGFLIAARDGNLRVV